MTDLKPNKTGRNTLCPCGSGKKFKACCIKSATHLTATTAIDIQNMQQQAQQAIAKSDFVEAEYWFRKLHIEKPKDAYFLASLGQALCWLNRHREGINFLLQAAKLIERQAIKSHDARFALELSGQLLHWGETQTAERLARLALKITPDSPVALNNLALCLTRVNRHREALPISRKTCELLPHHPGCNILLALIESQLGNVDQALSRLNHVIERNDEADQTARAHLEKGVILDKLGHHEAAFTAFTQAGQIHSSHLAHHPASREYLFDVLRRNSEGFDSGLLHRWPSESVRDDGLPSPAFLMGFLRSGTTLTEQVLDAHPHLMTTDESSIIHELTLELQKMSGIVDDHAKALKSLNLAQIKALRSFYWQRMREEYGDQVMHKRLIDKNALHTIELGLISVIFPESQILFALRDPRDVCLSCFMQAFSPSPATVNLLSWQGIATQYAAVMNYWLKLRKDLQPNYLELRYEDTVTNFEVTYRQVFNFFGVEWHPEVMKFHERAKGRYISTPSFSSVSQPIYRTAVARWKNYERQFQPILPQLQPFIDAFGYSDQS